MFTFGLAVYNPIWDATVFSKNLDRLLEGDIARAFLRGKNPDILAIANTIARRLEHPLSVRRRQLPTCLRNRQGHRH